MDFMSYHMMQEGSSSYHMTQGGSLSYLQIQLTPVRWWGKLVVSVWADEVTRLQWELECDHVNQARLWKCGFSTVVLLQDCLHPN